MTLFTNTVIPNDPLAKLLLPVPVPLFSVVLEVLFQRRGMLPTKRHDGDFNELEVNIATMSFLVPHASESKRRESYAGWGYRSRLLWGNGAATTRWR